jgi:hypothetical protein
MKEVSAAFVKAQKEFGPALKTKKNPHLKSNYADLSSVIEAVIDALHDNGLAVMQKSVRCEDGAIVETLFIHTSGEILSAGELHVPAPKRDPQGFGSALTYCRRYALMTACGIAPEDDDGEAAVIHMQRKQDRQAAEKREAAVENAAAVHAVLSNAAGNGKTALTVAWKALSPADRQLFGGAENLKQFEEVCKAADEKAAQ